MQLFGKPPARRPVALVVGVLAIAIETAVYAYEQTFMSFVTPAREAYFQSLADAYILILALGVFLVALDLYFAVSGRIAVAKSRGFVPLSPGWLVPYVLSLRRYKWFFAVTGLAYGVLYAVVSSMLVYQPGVDFVQAYGASFPSAIIAPCCGPPLFTPIVTVYVVNHLGLLFVPLTVLLLITISALVGVNSALAAFAFDSRIRGSGRGWLGGLGAVVGLFTGCPTCAGLFFANVIGGSGAVGFAAILAYYQPVFILFTLPVLVATLYLVSRSLAKVFSRGCVVLNQEASPIPP